MHLVSIFYFLVSAGQDAFYTHLVSTYLDAFYIHLDAFYIHLDSLPSTLDISWSMHFVANQGLLAPTNHTLVLVLDQTKDCNTSTVLQNQTKYQIPNQILVLAAFSRGLPKSTKQNMPNQNSPKSKIKLYLHSQPLWPKFQFGTEEYLLKLINWGQYCKLHIVSTSHV